MHTQSVSCRTPGVVGEPTVAARPVAGAEHVVISRFVVANDMTAQVKRAFRDRPHKVDAVDGFLRMEVISPVEEPDEIWLITFWRDEHSCKAWHASALFRESHRGIPKGLKLVPGSAGVRRFEGVSS